MQSLAGMLEERELLKVTTAELAKRSEISEAAIYKHFPSKRKIFEELVVFFEESIFTRIKAMKEESKPEDLALNNIFSNNSKSPFQLTPISATMNISY